MLSYQQKKLKYHKLKKSKYKAVVSNYLDYTASQTLMWQ